MKGIDTGDILLVSGTTKQAQIIQDFQCKEDEYAGIYNHSGIFYKAKSGLYVIEAALIQQRKVKAAVVITPIDHYLGTHDTLLHLRPKDKVGASAIEPILFNYVGTPYDYGNLLILQPIRLLFHKWLGRKRKTDKRMVCHEFTMTVWNDLRGIFPECAEADVCKMFYSMDFVKNKLQ